MQVFRVDLIGTGLGDYAYVAAPSAVAARSTVYGKLRKMHGTEESVPHLQVDESSREIAIRDFGRVSSSTPESLDKSIRGLDSGVPVFDFEDFEPDLSEGG